MTDSVLPADATVSRRSIYFERADALVVADVHAGRADASAVEFPLGERADLTERLGDLLDRFSPGEVVVAGDLLHSFDRIPPTVAETVDALAACVADAGANLVVVRGNHDTMLAGEAGDRFDLDHRDAYRLADGETLVCHGHRPPEESARLYVIGHEHPAIAIEGRKHPAILIGPQTYDGSAVVVLPAFNRFARGSTINGLTGRDALSPLLSAGVGDYRPVVYDAEADESLEFPPLSDLQAFL